MSASALPQVSVFAQGEALSRLEATGGIGSPFQSAGWLGCWLAATGGLADFRLVELASASGTTQLPLVLAKWAGGRIARKGGDGHASFFTPVRVGAPPPLTRDMLKTAARALGVDALVLSDCPVEWAGAPLFDVQGTPAPDLARGVTLTPEAPSYPGEAGKKLRAKARKLAARGVLSQGFLAGEDARAALAAMLDWKAAQFAARGIADPFAAPAMQRFLHGGLARGALRLFALQLDGRPIAALVLAGSGRHASGMSIAHDPNPDIARFGPGDVLVAQLVAALAQEGFTGFDLGVGDARYKRLHCPDAIALVDIHAAASLKGAAMVAAHALARRAKGAIKRNAAAFSALTALRARLLGHPAEA